MNPEPPSSANHKARQERFSQEYYEGSANHRERPNSATSATPIQKKITAIQREFATAETDLKEALDALDAIQRRRVECVMDLRGMGFTNTEIGSIIGLTPARVSGLVQKQRRTLGWESE